jgi:hypothetical protein
MRGRAHLLTLVPMKLNADAAQIPAFR